MQHRFTALTRTALALAIALAAPALMFTSADAYAVPMDKDKKEKKEKKEKKYKPRKSLREQGVAGVKVELISPVSGEDFTPVCPATTPEWLIDIFNVHKDKAENFGIYLTEPPTINYEFVLTSNSTNMTLDGRSSTQVTVPPGTQETTPFSVKATAIGEYSITAQRLGIDPATELPYPPFTIPVNVWEFDEIVDYNDLGGGLPCYDEANSPALINGYERTVCGFQPDAVASDGVSRLLMRLKSGMQGQACFKVVDDGINDVGKTEPDDSTSIATVADLADPYWAFGTYLPPNAFGDSPEKEREVEIEIAFTPAVASGALSNTLALRKKVKVRRPPVFLVHGVWSNPNTFSNEFMDAVSNDLTNVDRIDYKSVNTRSFDVIVPVVSEELRRKVDEMRWKKGMALTRADVVAHSLGGIVTRILIAGPDYKRPENFGEGDIHRFIALAAPLHGGQMGNLMINLHQEFPSSKFFEELASYGMELRNGAFCSVADNSRDLSYPAEDGVEGLSYTGTYYGEGFPGYFDFMFNGHFYYEQTEHIDPYAFLATTPNDGMVDLESGIGGLPTTNYPDNAHMDMRIDLAVASQVFIDLHANPGRFSTLPGYISTGLGEPRLVPGRGTDPVTGIDIDQINYAAQCDLGEPMNPTEDQLY